MPPVWLLAGTLIILAVALLADFLVLRPRSRIVVVDGKPIAVRRARDGLLLMAAMMVMFVMLAGIGFAIEGTFLVFVLVSLTFGVFIIYALWRAARADDSLPLEITSSRAAKENGRRLIAAVVAAVMGGVLNAASLETDGIIGWVLAGGSLACYLLVFWLFFRMWRVARAEKRSSADV